MAPRQSQTAKRKAKQNGMRLIELEVVTDSKARNVISFENPKEKPQKKKQRKSNQNVKKEKPIPESALKLPVLNTTVVAGKKIRSGKKGKKFVDDHDLTKLNVLIKSISDEHEKALESRLEKAHRLEQIRELKKKEIEEKEQKKQGKLEDKVKELKRKRRDKKKVKEHNAKKEQKEEKVADQDEKPKKKRKTVSFA